MIEWSWKDHAERRVVQLPPVWPLIVQVLPEKTVSLLLYLAPHHRASRSTRSVPSSLKLDFTVDESADAVGPVEQISDSQSSSAATLPSPPPMPARVGL